MQRLPQRIASYLLILWPVLLVGGRTTLEIGSGLIAVFFLADLALRREARWLNTPWVKALGLLCVYLFLHGLLIGGDARFEALTWLRFPLFAVATAWLLRDGATERHLLASLSLVIFFLVADSLLQFVIGHDVFGRLPRPTDVGSLRLTGPFSNPIVGIICCWLLFPPALYAFSRWQATRRRMHLLYAFMLFLGGMLLIFLSGERMALLLALLGVGMTFLLVPGLRRPLFVASVIGIMVAVMMVAAHPEILRRQLHSTIDTTRQWQDSQYGQIWQSAWQVSAEHPLFGVGVRQYRHACPELIAVSPAVAETRCNLHPHHVYLEWLTEAGMVGLALFVGFLGTIAWTVRRHWWAFDQRALVAGLVIAVTIRVWPLMTATSQFTGWAALPMWFMIGWLMAQTARERA